MLSDKPSERGFVSRILRMETELDRKAKALGVNFRLSQGRIHAQLSSLSFPALTQIENSLAHLNRSFEICIEQNTNPWDDREFFQLSMRELGLTYPSDFLDRLQRGDVVEAYDMSRMQIFRNMRFMEVSTYSLLEVLSYEWPQLFERPSHITQLIIKQTERDMWSENRVIDSDVPAHFVRETLSGSPQVCEAHHRLFAPLFSGPGKPGGILSVGAATTIVSNIDVAKDRISFI